MLRGLRERTNLIIFGLLVFNMSKASKFKKEDGTEYLMSVSDDMHALLLKLDEIIEVLKK